MALPPHRALTSFLSMYRPINAEFDQVSSSVTASPTTSRGSARQSGLCQACASPVRAGELDLGSVCLSAKKTLVRNAEWALKREVRPQTAKSKDLRRMEMQLTERRTHEIRGSFRCRFW